MTPYKGCAMAQAVSRWPLITEARVRSQVKSMWDLWWTKWHWDRFFSEVSVFPCQFHSTGAPLLVKRGQKLLIFITGVAQKALRLWCVRSIFCGGPSPCKKKNTPYNISFIRENLPTVRHNTHLVAQEIANKSNSFPCYNICLMPMPGQI
jgi:hypothetical protein